LISLIACSHQEEPMIEKSRWEAPPSSPSKPDEQGFNLDRALESIVALRASIPADAFTASILGVERAGSGVVIGESGLVLTIGYLITEAESVWLTGADGRVIPAHALAYDQETGFGLVQALDRLDLPALELGRASEAKLGDSVVLASSGRSQSVRARIVGKQEFAGYWEYLLNEAIFTAPAHPFWGGAGLIGQDGKLLGIGSLHVQQVTSEGRQQDINMIVPIDLLPPILDDLLKFGRRRKPPRPWLGLYATEVEDKLVIAGLAGGGPAEQADLRVGDLVMDVGGEQIADLASLFRRIWARGDAGVEVPLTVVRDGRPIAVSIRSADRASFLRAPRLH
jgi:S1-C subfamily serine protease